jgi:arsenite methyltransferase
MMKNAKEIVKEKYGQIARENAGGSATSCCGQGCSCSGVDYSVFSENYEQQPGYQVDADLGLGCGIPTEFARISEGDTVIDLGSGAGNDCFVARSLAGENGEVIGIDFTEDMITRARANAAKLNFQNVSFRLGDIENIPMTTARADVVISNCVLNLLPDKQKAFSEIFRVLKPGGHFSISDVVLVGALPEKLQSAAEMYAGCVSGAIQKEEYLHIIRLAGFSNIRIDKERALTVPDQMLLEYISASELDDFRQSGTGIFSINVYAERPSISMGCGCGCGCS